MPCCERNINISLLCNSPFGGIAPFIGMWCAYITIHLHITMHTYITFYLHTDIHIYNPFRTFEILIWHFPRLPYLSDFWGHSVGEYDLQQNQPSVARKCYGNSTQHQQNHICQRRSAARRRRLPISSRGKQCQLRGTWRLYWNKCDIQSRPWQQPLGNGNGEQWPLWIWHQQCALG